MIIPRYDVLFAQWCTTPSTLVVSHADCATSLIPISLRGSQIRRTGVRSSTTDLHTNHTLLLLLLLLLKKARPRCFYTLKVGQALCDAVERHYSSRSRWTVFQLARATLSCPYHVAYQRYRVGEYAAMEARSETHLNRGRDNKNELN